MEGNESSDYAFDSDSYVGEENSEAEELETQLAPKLMVMEMTSAWNLQHNIHNSLKIYSEIWIITIAPRAST